MIRRRFLLKEVLLWALWCYAMGTMGGPLGGLAAVVVFAVCNQVRRAPRTYTPTRESLELNRRLALAAVLSIPPRRVPGPKMVYRICQ